MTTEGGPAPRVVVGVDGSAESVGALNWAAHYAAATGATTTGRSRGTFRSRGQVISWNFMGGLLVGGSRWHMEAF